MTNGVVGKGLSRTILITAAFACALPMMVTATVKSAPAQDSGWTEVGVLDCTIGPSIGLVVGARQHARCVFKSRQMGKSTFYIGRLTQVDRAAGLPSGGKLVWTAFAKSSAGVSNDLLGQYRPPGEAAETGKRDICKVPSQAICLRPAVTENQWKENQAAAILGMKLETGTRSRKTSDKKI